MFKILSLVQVITLCEEFVAAMQVEFKMTMMGEITYFLGLQVTTRAMNIFRLVKILFLLVEKV